MRFSFRSLSFRLLMLTGFFVMLSEVLIYTPSVARYRLVYLQEKLETAYLAAQAVRVAPDGMLSDMMTKDLLNQVGAHTVIVFRDGTAREMLERAPRPMANVEIDLRTETFFGLIWDAFETLSQLENRVLRVTGGSPDGDESLLIVEIDEAPMRDEMLDYSFRILNLSIFISLVTAGLVFLSLRWLMVRPLERITKSMTAFQEAPEDRTTDIDDEGRRDEIGVALRELAAMKEALRSALRQQTRLAALGTAVNKISHDLRNMLSTATLISDSLAQSDDPKVRRVAPTLIQSIDRAAALCSTTLNFTRDTPALTRTPVILSDVMREIGGCDLASGADIGGESVRVETGYGANLAILADRDQIFRVFANLARNAVHAGARRISVDAWPGEGPGGGMVRIEVSDNGPGIPEATQAKLFQPFGVTTKKDGSGLGLAIARDIVQAHGGTLSLSQTGPGGTRFTVMIPAADKTA
jgi:signal transduction histidine kinase